MIKVLAIGNSFSQDATAYLHEIAGYGNMDCKIVNLYIGGCSLARHWDNAENDKAEYSYELNGARTGRMVSIKETLLEDEWDYVTMQQASDDSGIDETYYPYITKLSAYVKEYAPNAVQMIHETWAYETDSTHKAFPKYGCSQQTMYEALRAAYKKAAETLGVRIIPSGGVIQALRSLKEFDYPHGGQSLCRDGFHMHLVYGRYATAATWYEALLGGNILENSFVPHVEGQAADEKRLHLIAATIHSLCHA